MIRYWKIVLAVSVVLFLAGLVLLGTGLMTGASPDRIVELVFGGRDALLAMFNSAKAEVLQLLP